MDHADQPVVDRHRRTGVTRLTAHLVDEGARLVARSPGHAAGVPGGAAQLARDVADERVRAESIDLKSVDVVDRVHLLRVELDDRIVEGIVACHHLAEHTGVLMALRANLRAGATAVRGRESDQVASVVVADRGERAQRLTVDDQTRTAAQSDGILGVSGCGGRQQHAQSGRAIEHWNPQAAAAAPQVENLLDVARPAFHSTLSSLTSAGIVWPRATWQHEPQTDMNAGRNCP